VLRNWLKYIIGFALFYSGILRIYNISRRQSGKSEVILLGYHRVLDLSSEGHDYSQRGLVTSVRNFASQIAYVKRHYGFISLDQLLYARNGKEHLPARSCIMSLDGWFDSYRWAFPILRDQKLPAVVFLTTDYIGTSRAFWHTKMSCILLTADLSRRDSKTLNLEIFPPALATELKRLYSLGRRLTVDDLDEPIEIVKRLASQQIDEIIEGLSKILEVPLSALEQRRFLLNWEEVKDMAQHGIEIGSHSRTHGILPLLPTHEVKKELGESKSAIERHTGMTVNVFACPNGECNAEIQRLILDAGYQIGFFQFNDHDKLEEESFTLRRICVHDGMSTNPWGEFSRCLFAFELSGILDIFR